MINFRLKSKFRLSQLTASSSDLAAALQLSMKAVQHENVDIRIHALTSLRDMMHSNQVCWCCDSYLEVKINISGLVQIRNNHPAHRECLALCPWAAGVAAPAGVCQ